MKEGRTSLWRQLNWPNRISLLRLIGIVPMVILLLYQQQWYQARHLALAIMALMAASDALDGYLARCRGQMTKLGRFLDPLADKLLIITTVILLATDTAAVPGLKLDRWVVVAIVGKDLWVVLGFVVILMFTGSIHISPTRAGKLCTVVQLAMVIAYLTAPDMNWIFAKFWPHAGNYVAIVLSYAAVAACILAAISYTRMGMAVLSQAEKREHDRLKQQQQR